MVVIGPISSLFDFLTFFILGAVLHLPEHQFQTGWFMESLATQIFVVYIIRTKLVPFLQSRPSAPVVAGTLAMVGIGWIVALTSLRSLFSFDSVPVAAVASIVVMVLIYLALVEAVKRWFYLKLVRREDLASM
jgi:Mg2+-importing ATPase